jgi:hypothetical protein
MFMKSTDNENIDSLRDQKRRTAIISVLVVGVLISFGIATYYFVHLNKTSSSSSNSNTNLISTEVAQGRFIETYGYFSLKVPPKWMAGTFIIKSGSVIALVPAENTEVRLGPNSNNLDSGNSVTVEVYKANPDLAAWEKLEANQSAASSTSINNLAIDGQPTFLENTNSNGNQSLTYYVGHGAYIVKVSMQVTIASANIDNSKYISQFKSIAQSLIILK